MSEPYPLEPAQGAAARPDDGPQEPDLTDLDGQAREVDEAIERGEQ